MKLWFILSGIFGFSCLIIGVIMCAMINSGKISRQEEMEEILDEEKDCE